MRLLILSGTHGDEGSIIPVLEKYIAKNKKKLPKFLFIPKLSPSAVSLKTRVNKNGNDLNRNFVDGAEDDEAIAAMKLLKKYKFDLCLNFHEDIEVDGYYIYDSGLISEKYLKQLIKRGEKIGLKPFNGIDDPNDPVLKNKIKNGYKSFLNIPDDAASGTFESWAILNNVVKRTLTIEVPTSLSVSKKERFIELIFDFCGKHCYSLSAK